MKSCRNLLPTSLLALVATLCLGPAVQAASRPVQTYISTQMKEVEVFGQVVSDSDGEPIPDARVGFTRVWDRCLDVTTDSEGKFTFTVERHILKTLPFLTCYSPGHCIASKPVTPLFPSTNHVEASFRLVPGKRLSGRVALSETGRSVAGIPVVLKKLDTTWRNVFPTLQATTEEDGRYTFDGLGAGQYEVEIDAGKTPYAVTHASRARVKIGDGKTHEAPRLSVEPGGRIEGLTLDSKRMPVPVARLELVPMDAASDAPAILLTASDWNGVFRFEGVRLSTPYRLIASSNGFDLEVRENLVALKDAPTPFVETALDRGASASGKVVFPDDDPVEYTRVQLHSGDDHSVETRIMQSETTGGDGSFKFTGLSPGPYEVSLEPGRLQETEASRVSFVVEQGNDVANLKLVVGHAGPAPRKIPRVMLEGVVITEEQTPVADAIVTALGSPRESAWRKHNSARTDAEGRFAISRRAGKPVDVIVKSAKGNAAVEDVPPDQELTLVVRKDVGISGTVVDDSGNPVSGCTVYLMANIAPALVDEDYRTNLREQRRDSDKTTSNEAGRFLFKPVRAGTYVVKARCSDTVLGTSEAFTVSSWESRTGVVVPVSEGGVLAGVVVDPLGRPVPRANVSVHYHLDDPKLLLMVTSADRTLAGQYGITDEEGRFEFRGLPEGSFRVTASHSDHVRAQPVDRVLAAGQRVRDLQLKLKEGGCVSGSIRGGVGDTGFSVQTEPRSGMSFARVNSDGTFNLCGLKPGEYELFLKARSQGGTHYPYYVYPQCDVQAVAVLTGETAHVEFGPVLEPASLSLVLANKTLSQHEFTFRHLANSGIPMDVAGSFIWGIGEGEGIWGMFNDQGTVVIHEIPPGDYLLEISKSAVTTHHQRLHYERVSLAPGERLSLGISLDP